ncbi:MAG: anti-sigma factor [Paenibacillaceae bacterium]
MEHHIDELVSAYIDNELSDKDRQTVKDHLQCCQQCNQLVEELLHIQSEVMGFFQRIHAPVGLENKVLAKINLKSPIKSGVFTIGISLIFIFTTLYFFGSFIFKAVSICTKILIGIIYTGTQFIGDQPMTRMSVILFAIILLVISGFALWRLLHYNSAEGDESFG